MAISGQLNINIGLPNESTGSDSLYTAFNKIQDNFSNVFACASPYSNIIAGNGITVDDDSANGNITIDNAGVINIIPSSSINVSDDGFGNITLQVIGDGSNIVGGVQSVGLQSASSLRLTVSGASNPIVDSGIFIIDLATSGATAGTYTYPTMTIDSYGRVTSISSGASVGTVTSVGLTPGSGIQITGGPVTTSGAITVTNTGVTSLVAGSGIVLSGSTGAVTISSPGSVGTVTSVALTSATLNVSGSPIVESGIINIEVPTNFVAPGNVTVGATGRFVAGTPEKVNIYGSNGDIYTSGNVSVGGANVILYNTGTVTANNLSCANDLYAGNLTTLDGNVVINGGTSMYGGLALYNTTSINFIDSVAPSTDTSIYYYNSGGNEALVFAINGTNKLELYNTQVKVGANLVANGSVILNSVDVLTNGSAVNLSTYTTRFTTTSAWTATLAAGITGQIKTFIMTGDGGDMIITVTNAGWPGAGTMTFDTVGDGCTLQYIDNKWYCTGNNGVVFA